MAGYATLKDGQVRIAALVGRPDGSELVQRTISGPVDQAEALGDELGRRLLAQGADRILEEIMGNDPR